jgi:hypothetical protein
MVHKETLLYSWVIVCTYKMAFYAHEKTLNFLSVKILIFYTFSPKFIINTLVFFTNFPKFSKLNRLVFGKLVKAGRFLQTVLVRRAKPHTHTGFFLQDLSGHEQLCCMPVAGRE